MVPSPGHSGNANRPAATRPNQRRRVGRETVRAAGHNTAGLSGWLGGYLGYRHPGPTGPVLLFATSSQMSA